jgi:oxygen-independent coproporphyrinogen III oxidase
MADIPETISLYIHIPFCVRKCNYCDFYSVPYDTSLADAYVRALCIEWEQKKKQYCLEHTSVQSIYFGGGTPSLLSEGQWQELKRGLIDNLTVAPDLEWTVECNPDSFTEEKAALWHSMGVTRLTIGVQSLDDGELATLGRPHTARQALSVLGSPVLSVFHSTGADLMYGLPQQTVVSFGRSLEIVLSMDAVKHLSAYELAIGKNTPFGRQTDLPLPSEDDVCEMAKLLFAKTKAAGFERYEISNFAKKGHRCRHNQSYWDHSPYLGLGAAAHSFIGSKRSSNVRDVARYISGMRTSLGVEEFSEIIDQKKREAEAVLLRLRTTDGLDEDRFAAIGGTAFYGGGRCAVLDDLLKRGLMRYERPVWSLTEEGMLLCDAVIRRLV